MILHTFACNNAPVPHPVQFCLACGTQICACFGGSNGQCPVCYRGLLSQFAKPRGCGYKGCTAHAVAASPRVGYACLEHAKTRGGYDPYAHPTRITEYHQDGQLAYYSVVVRDRIAKGTQASGV